MVKGRLTRGTTKVVGVMGFPVKHSLSPAMHNAAFEALEMDWVYVPFEVSPEDIPEALKGVKSLGIIGVNVTVPHKENVMPYLSEISEDVHRIGAVNTIINDRGKLRGLNTDSVGFVRSLGKEAEGNGRTAFIYGAGGSARAVASALQRQKWRVVIHNRTRERAEMLARSLNESGAGYNQIEVVSDNATAVNDALQVTSLFVNCTPIGMHPIVDQVPAVEIRNMPYSSIIYDLIYHPLETQLLKAAKQLGYRTMNGAEMLVQQGAEAFELWTEQKAPVDVMRKALLSCLT